MRQRGIEPRSTAWKATMLTITPLMPIVFYKRWPNFLIKKNFKGERGKIIPASAGNRTPINCLEGNYANHYTTDADG